MTSAIRSIVICGALAGALAACGTSGRSGDTLSSPIPFDPARASDSRLGPQNLAPGQCGLFLWGKSASRPLQFFQNSKTQAVNVPFKPDATVTRLSAENAVMDGLFARQSFRIGDLQMEVTIEVSEGRNVLQGVAISGGTIELTEPSGRATLIPVVGLFGCSN